MGARRRKDIAFALRFRTLALSAITLILHFRTLAQEVSETGRVSPSISQRGHLFLNLFSGLDVNFHRHQLSPSLSM